MNMSYQGPLNAHAKIEDGGRILKQEPRDKRH